ncbi:thiolase family protein [Loktanella sp. S4079]|uniref:thiolase family protein n=1 Tax=Loktanella sp. S4079 TaxID=579483 RepID=UPI0005F9D259|nr:thiolase family protein [Loktanella sp. S4079]KJZ19177.1 acetyl-CoA acetyltransferase [Loktanella sp. S4079]
MARSYVIAARRSPVVPRNGAFAALQIEDLARPVISTILRDAGIATNAVGELIASNALGAGGNPARIIALHAGLPQNVAGMTIDRQCAGGLDALVVADALIRAGVHDVVIAGGVESYSRRPIRLRTFADGSDPVRYDQARFTPWADRDPDMARAADQLAQKMAVTREDQDRWAMGSHAQAKSYNHPEIVPMCDVESDSFTRDLTTRHCSKAPVVSGSVAAANMAIAADGAAFVVMVSEQFLRRIGMSGVLFSAGVTLGGVPDMPGLAPVEAVNACLKSAQITVNDLTHIELMEAFAVQAIACQQGADLPRELVNRFGGALAWGHPIGASGAILAARLFHQLSAKGGVGIAAIASAGGIGSAVLLRRD